MIARQSLYPRIASLAAGLAVVVVGHVCGAAPAPAAIRACKVRRRAERCVQQATNRSNWRYIVAGALRRWGDDPELLTIARVGLGAAFAAQAPVVVRAAVLRLCAHVGAGGWAELDDARAVRVWLTGQVALAAHVRLSGYLVAGLCRRWVHPLTGYARGLLPPGDLPGAEAALVHETLTRFVRDLPHGLATLDPDAAWGRLQEIMVGLQQMRAALEDEVCEVGREEESAAREGWRGPLSQHAHWKLRRVGARVQDADPTDFAQDACLVWTAKACDYVWEGTIARGSVLAAMKTTIDNLISNAARLHG